MKSRLTRRLFLRQAGIVGGVLARGYFVNPHSAAASSSPNEKLNIAAIGVGGRGAENVVAVAGENIVALCDVDDRRAARTFENFPQARRYRDFRRMFDEMDRQIDAVVVSTPDHTHAPAAAIAMRLGKHCYCEKPLTHSVHESRVLTELARGSKLATQMGTQIHNHPSGNYRRVVALIQSGTIGKVRQVEVQFPGGWRGRDRPRETSPVPEGLDWDLWLGPASHRPYHPDYVPEGWRAWWDFGGGVLGDFGCHYLDLPFWALELKYPTSIAAEGPPPHLENAETALTVRYEFPARGDLPPVTLTWRNGRGIVAPIIQEKNLPNWGAAVLFVGEKGMLLANYTRRMLLPEAEFAGLEPAEPTSTPPVEHHREWIEACKTGRPTSCNFEYSGPLTEAILLGIVSYRVRSELQWDANSLKARNCPAADSYIRREYRNGWIL